MEELKKLQKENKSLLQEIEVLEIGKGIATEIAQSSSFSELLLSIDTLAMPGMIGTEEASNLREKVEDNRNMVQSSFYDIHHKTDAELLSALWLFLTKNQQRYLSMLCTFAVRWIQ